MLKAILLESQKGLGEAVGWQFVHLMSLRVIVCPFLSALGTPAPPASQASNANCGSLTEVHPSTCMKQRKSICCPSAKGTNPCFRGGSISSLLVSATGTNKTTEPNQFTKNDDSSALVISWVTEPGWVPHYISQDAFSSKKRINMVIFYRCRRKQFCKVYNTKK